MRKLRWLGLIVLIYGVAVWLKPLPQPIATINLNPPATSTVNLAWPSAGQAAVATTDLGLLTTHGNQTPVPMASIAKIVTALVVLQKYPLQLGSAGLNIKLTNADVAIYQKYLKAGGSVVPVQADETISQYQALEAMLLPSANNIADSLAIWAYGSMDGFLAATTQYLNSIGLTQTKLADASGFSPASRSTATDLAELGITALDNPVIAKLVATKQANLPGAGTVKNVNWLLGIDGVDGIKTGNTTQAGGCYLASAHRTIASQSVTIVTAILGDTNLQRAITDGDHLLNSTIGGLEPVTIPIGQTIGSYTTHWGQSTPIIASPNLSLLVWRSQSYGWRTQLTNPVLPISKNQTVGKILITAGGEQTNLTVASGGSITKPSITWRLTHVF